MAKQGKKLVVHSEGYTREFKVEAVRLLEARTKSAEALAMDLGVKRNQLYKWQAELRGKAEAAFPGRGAKPLAERSELERLRRELKETKEQLEILKKAEAYFAEASKQGTR